MSADTSHDVVGEARVQYIANPLRAADDLLIVEQSGRPAAAIISLAEYQRFVAWREERAARRAWVLERDPRRRMPLDQWQAQFTALDRVAAQFGDITDETLQAELDEALAATRVAASGRKRD